MRAVTPHAANGWGGLALPYHLHKGWYEESPWVVDDLDGAVRHWQTIDASRLDQPTREVFVAVGDLLARAQAANHTVSIFSE